MGMLDRYKKSGGFVQLLSLIETFGPQKQEKFLTLIEEENPNWSKAIKDKLITIDRIFSWPKETLAEIVPTMNHKTIAIALSGLKTEYVEKLYSGIPNSEKRKIELEKQQVQPNPNEVVTSHVKLIEAVRGMITRGELRAEKFDAGLVVDEKFEENLLHSSNFIRGDSEKSTDADEDDSAGGEVIEIRTDLKAGDPKLAAELKSMQSLLLNLQKENKSLRSEVKILKDKLEQIKKIA